MQYGYIVKISNKNIYREVQLPVDAEIMKVGMSIDCDARFYKESFFEDFELVFRKQNGVWHLSCSENLYIDAGDVRKLLTKELAHGDSFSIKYQNSESELFKIDFLFDFDNENKDYSRGVNVSTVNNFYIGNASNCNIVLNSEYVKNDLVEFSKKPDGSLVANIKATTYGLYHNGSLAKNGEVIKNGDFFSIADFSFYYKNGVVCTSRSVKVNSLSFIDAKELGDYPKFIKNSRIHSVLNEEDIEILDPSSKPEKPKSNLFMSLLPSMGMMLTSGAMMMSAQGSGTMILFSGVSAGMAVVTAVVGFVDNKKNYKKSLEQRIVDYNNYINRKKTEITNNRVDEREQLESLFYDFKKEYEMLENFSPNLFDRQDNDWDFLFVRVGSGYVKSKREIQHKKQEKLELDDDLQSLPEQIKEDYKFIENAPVVCDFKTANAVCICGKEENRFALFKNILFDICVRHFYSDVQIFLVCEEKNRNKINWLRFIPHINNDSFGGRNIVCDDESRNRIFDYLYKELTQRQSEKEDVVQHPHIVIFLYDEYGFQFHPISKFVKNGSKLGVTFIFMSDSVFSAPTGCKYLINATSHTNGRIIDTSNNSLSLDFTYVEIDNEAMKKMVEIIAPVYTEEISLESSLTKNISLFEMMKILLVDDIDLRARWDKSMVYKSMAAPIGVTKNELVYLDLHDKAHGPHGLVAGTTGSGKSEILQTYILSMATLFHPYEVGFVIIDFKGGGMVNQFKELPHLIGAITNIDGKEIDRSLKSIKAELQKRQRLFAEAGVNHIDKYIKKYKAKEVNVPIPHLVLIVDEFAELKAEQPEFMKELISAARIGRSLGVHLILATQKPSGQVDDQIWSNSRFKLCLKVQSVEDSNEVLKSPLAAEIKEPGRAYLQVGNNEIFELFQSAYSGAPEKMTESNIKEFSIVQISESGKRKEVFSQKKKKNGDENKNQLEAIVDHVHNYCDKENIIRLPNICLPPLPEVILQPEKIEFKDKMIDIGIYDDPDNQIQSSAFIDVDNKNTLIIGSSQYGKTNLLQSMIKSLSTRTSPKQSVFYILDFGSMVLKNFEDLNHVGGVVTSSEDEKLKNLFKLLSEEISIRKEKLLSVGVSSFSSYIEAGYDDLPHIYLIIDNLTALSELYLEDDDSLLSIIREGVSFGISAIVANSQTSGIGYKYISNFANKIVLYCNDSSEYTNVFEHVEVRPDEKTGRCILELDKRMLECQTYLAFEGEKEIDRVHHMRSFIDKNNNTFKGMRAKQIPFIPNTLTEEDLQKEFGASVKNNLLPIGLTYSDVKPYYLDLNQLGIIGITGREGFGHKNITSYILKSLINSTGMSRIVIFDDVTRKFAEYKNKVDVYSLNTDAIVNVISDWHQELERRYNQMLLDDKVSASDELLIMIIQNNDVALAIQSDIDTTNKFNDIVTRYKNMGVCIIFSNYPNSSISYDAPEAIRMIRQNQHVICLEDLQNLKCFDPPYEAIRENKKPIALGDGYYIKDNDVVKLKFVLSE